MAFSVVLGCDFFKPAVGPAPGPLAVPIQNKPVSVSGGSGNRLSVDNGVMRVSIAMLGNEPILKIAGENIPIYRDEKIVNSTALEMWFKAVELFNADLPPENRVALETVQLAVKAGVPEEAVQACVSVIRDLGIDVVVEPQPEKN